MNDKPYTLTSSLKLSLTFWIIAGIFVWLNICTINKLYSFNSDVIKLLAASFLWYGVIGLIFWLPVHIFSGILKKIRLFGSNDFRLQLGTHWFIGFMLTYFYLVHKVWLAYSAALSMQGLLVSLLIALSAIITGWILVKIASILSRIKLFRSNLTTLFTLFFLIMLLYAGSSVLSGVANHMNSYVPEELNQTLPTDAKAVLIGFDGATWEAINPLMKAGRMPNFKKFLQDGIGVPLRTSQPTLSAILWTTVATGKTSKGHGVKDIVSTITPGLENNVLHYPYIFGCDLFTQFLMKRGFFYVTPLSSSARQTKAVWNILSDYDKRSGVIGWWGTFPPEEINGVVVSDHASMAKNIARQAKGQLSYEGEMPEDLTAAPVYPPELMTELAPFAEASARMSMEELNYFIEADSAKLNEVNQLSGWDREHPESVIKISYLTDKFFRKTTEHLLDTQSFDLLLTYLFESDAMGHWMWYYREPEYFPRVTSAQKEMFGSVMDSAYVNVDRMLGSLMQHIPEDYHVIIISDHGFGVEKFGDAYDVGHKLAPDGILMMRGPQFKANADIVPKAGLEDITPTLLTLLGIPVGEDMEGRVLTEAFKSDFLNRYPVRTIASHDRGESFRAKATFSDQDNLLKDKLRALGYID